MSATEPTRGAGRRLLPVLAIGAGLLVAVVLAAATGASASETVTLVGLAGGGSVVTVLLTVLLLTRLRDRPLAVHTFVVALGAVVATAVGVGVAAWAMFLSSHDLGVLAVVLVLSATVSAGAAWALGGSFRTSVDVVRTQIAALAGDHPAPAGDGLVTAELQRLSDGLAAAHHQLVRASARADRLEGSRRELVAWVSHDLRSPIAALRAMAEALEDGVVAEETDVVAYHRAIRQETERLARLVDDLFELSRIEAGAVAEDVPFVPLHELVAEVVDAARGRAAAHGVELAADLEEVGSELVVAADLRRALDNVLDNAIAHTPIGGVVAVGASAGGEGMVLAVRDECGGIPDDDLDRVFDVAFRGDDSRSRTTGGGGLGLAIARGLIEAREGQISVRNRTRGCEFTLRLPATAGGRAGER